MLRICLRRAGIIVSAPTNHPHPPAHHGHRIHHTYRATDPSRVPRPPLYSPSFCQSPFSPLVRILHPSPPRCCARPRAVCSPAPRLPPPRRRRCDRCRAWTTWRPRSKRRRPFGCASRRRPNSPPSPPNSPRSPRRARRPRRPRLPRRTSRPSWSLTGLL
ncbi:hypothetical protein BU14_1283s0002 [Porphyra umbilicalis]|uniref:Uncharacterized protein n=1 Tax=Porphyra umbilicalis TaxID=2786 RepID=A0A1X6NM65_PORUM|nr:hypothetical protein BU14_1283s0002 [Porphyra umbilicalis]|eukprot:OSX69678.1 hypothetical protein BU14_1283s0002 [Porphyra umbilicalis]